MNNIKNILRLPINATIKVDCISIEYTSGVLRVVPNTISSFRNRISITGGSPLEGEFKEYSEYSKEQFEKFQKIMLQAYVSLHDELEEAINNSDSKSNLDVIKKNLLDIREQLRIITKYIDSYGDLLEEYKGI